MNEKKCIQKACSLDIGKILVFGILILLLSGSAASAADTGWVVPPQIMEDQGVTIPQNAYANDNSYAQFCSNGIIIGTIMVMVFLQFQWSTIDGIEVNARGFRHSGCGSNRYMRVRLSCDSGTTWTSYY